MTSYPTVEAVDIGYGNTKHSKGLTDKGDICCQMFPSIAPISSTHGDLGGGIGQSIDTIRIDVNGVSYEVGPDAALAQAGKARSRSLVDDYCKSDTYLALLRGALYRIGNAEIDLLVLGLPVSTYDAHKQDLLTRAAGWHDCAGFRVNVKNVRVYPQPLGGFFDHAIRSGLFDQMSTETNLLIDPGFYTLDWLVTNGIKTLPARSGAANAGGMGSVLEVIRDQIAKDHSVDRSDLGDASRIDEALRTGRPLRVYKDLIDVSKYRAIGEAKAHEAVKELAEGIGTAGDIANIILVGGGAHFYKSLLEKRFPRHDVVLAHEPVFANVRGFRLIGQRRVRDIVKSVLRAA